MKIILLFLSSMIFIDCIQPVDPDDNTFPDYSFGIHFLKDTTLTEPDIASMHIDSLKLIKNPWLSDKDIDFYDFSTHSIYLKKDKSHFFKNYEGSFFRFEPMDFSKPFVVIANPQRCYVGDFHSSLLSSLPLGPYINELDVCFYPDDILHISREYSSKEDIRDDSIIADVLIHQNLYHSGIEIELNSVQIINNSDTATIEYTISIYNNDQDNLYIIDPLKMDSNLFHYFTNGPELSNPSIPLYIYSEYKRITMPDPYDSWDFNWFTLIESNQSIQRTIQLKGYPHIPNGNYSIYMNLGNPKRIDKANRNRNNGRIWIGEIRSNIIETTL